MAVQTADRPFATVNPYTNETVREFETLDADQLDAAVQTAHEAFLAWRLRPIEERAAIVCRAGKLMLERSTELAGLLTLEIGKLIIESQWEVGLAASILEYYGEHGPQFASERRLDVDEGSAVILSAPLGVLLGVEPWNFPLYQVVRFAGPNLVLGNTILLKHATDCPQSALALERLVRDAGAPAGVYTNIFAAVSEIGRLIENPLVQGASLTGSERAGASVGEIAGRNLKKSVLELGGSDPFIVLDGEQLDRTIDAAVAGRMANTGQSCVASKRFIVLDELFDEFVAGMRDRFAALRSGDPADPHTTLGPVSSERAAVGLMDQIDDAVEKGATLVIGGGRVDSPGAFVEATILTDVTPDMRAYHEELFGPVAVVYRVPDEDAAVELANATPFGLGGSIYCADLERARRVADRIESGMVWINEPTSTQADLPFGGIKRSGYGRELSDLGMHEFVNHKLIRTLPANTGARSGTG
jgi:succinate-semialdehyde dehydrogenase / glutarate-semialdehyde dehydrogenase